MKFRIRNSISAIAIGAVMTATLALISGFPKVSYAFEEIGDLVFTAMNEMNKQQEVYTKDLQPIREKRQGALSNRDHAKNRFLKAKSTFDRREFHAELAMAQAQVFAAILDEAKLTSSISKKQLEVICSLADKLDSGEGTISVQDTQKIIQTAKPLIRNGTALLNSLQEYSDKITDPQINAKLNYAVQTASMLKRYVDSKENSATNGAASERELKKRVGALKDQLIALYVQTDIVKDMLKDRTNMLKMITEIAMVETSLLAVVGSEADAQAGLNTVKVHMMDPIKKDDEILTLLSQPISQDSRGRTEGPTTFVQTWKKGIQ